MKRLKNEWDEAFGSWGWAELRGWRRKLTESAQRVASCDSPLLSHAPPILLEILTRDWCGFLWKRAGSSVYTFERRPITYIDTAGFFVFLLLVGWLMERVNVRLEFEEQALFSRGFFGNFWTTRMRKFFFSIIDVFLNIFLRVWSSIW